MTTVAHISHWWTELLYVAPVVVVVAGLALSNRREKRRARRSGVTPDSPA